MKLFTEEQVKKVIKDSFLQGIERNTNYESVKKSILNSLTPIELPSDEEIEQEARIYCNIKESLVIDEEERYYKDFQKYDGFKACAKWMRDKIQGEV